MNSEIVSLLGNFSDARTGLATPWLTMNENSLDWSKVTLLLRVTLLFSLLCIKSTECLNCALEILVRFGSVLSVSELQKIPYQEIIRNAAIYGYLEAAGD